MPSGKGTVQVQISRLFCAKNRLAAVVYYDKLFYKLLINKYLEAYCLCTPKAGFQKKGIL